MVAVVLLDCRFQRLHRFGLHRRGPSKLDSPGSTICLPYGSSGMCQWSRGVACQFDPASLGFDRAAATAAAVIGRRSGVLIAYHAIFPAWRRFVHAEPNAAAWRSSGQPLAKFWITVYRKSCFEQAGLRFMVERFAAATVIAQPSQRFRAVGLVAAAIIDVIWQGAGCGPKHRRNSLRR